MRVMVLVKATAESETGAFPQPWTTQMMAAMGRFNDELRAVGILRLAGGLQPTAQAKRVAFDGTARTVIDGPFAHTRELVAGFWLWEVADMAEALAWVKRCPNPMPGPSEIEIRPLHDIGNAAAQQAWQALAQERPYPPVGPVSKAPPAAPSADAG